jgi:hypothetical protein
MNEMNRLMITAVLLFLSTVTASAAQWDATSAAFHVHVIAVGNGFELHVHDKAKHLPVDLTRGKVTATMLKDGKRVALPLVHKQTGIMTSASPLAGKWAMLVAFQLTGTKPQQVRFASTSESKDDHDHDGAHDHKD